MLEQKDERFEPASIKGCDSEDEREQMERSKVTTLLPGSILIRRVETAQIYPLQDRKPNISEHQIHPPGEQREVTLLRFSIEVVYELTKCLRLKYSHFSYNSNLPLIIYNVVLLVGDKRAWDTIRMMVDRTQFPRIYNPSCESAIISIISREFQALARLRCMGSVSPSVFYSTIVKKLFIGTSSRLWGQFILLFVSRGWEVAGRLIYHLLSELALKGTS